MPSSSNLLSVALVDVLRGQELIFAMSQRLTASTVAGRPLDLDRQELARLLNALSDQARLLSLLAGILAKR